MDHNYRVNYNITENNNIDKGFETERKLAVQQYSPKQFVVTIEEN